MENSGLGKTLMSVGWSLPAGHLRCALEVS